MCAIASVVSEGDYENIIFAQLSPADKTTFVHSLRLAIVRHLVWLSK